jgi:hypothetical protein
MQLLAFDSGQLITQACRFGTILFVVVPTVGLEPGSEKFKEEVADESGYGGNFKIRGGKDVADRPGDASLPAHTGALKFSHQKIGIKQEHNEGDFDQGSPGVFLHGKY